VTRSRRPAGAAKSRGTALAVALGGALALTGCGPSATAAEQAAQRFVAALEAKDGAAACALLAPLTVREVAQDAPCPEAVLEEEVPTSAASVEGERYGEEALVRTGQDTLFLSLFADGWRVVAAGCEPSPDGPPYDCSVSGG
jgi:hypothetical protein